MIMQATYPAGELSGYGVVSAGVTAYGTVAVVYRVDTVGGSRRGYHGGGGTAKKTLSGQI